MVALRADIDALPMADEKDVPYRSTVPGACHACGHDVHASVLLGAGLFLAGQAAAGLLPGRVRLVFQPAEETAGGALDVLAAGGIASVGGISPCTATLGSTPVSSAFARARSPPPATRSRSACPGPAGTPPGRT